MWTPRSRPQNRFSGFSGRQGNCRSTGLKPGVNEKKRRSSTCLLEFSDNLLTWGVLGSANLLNRLNGLSSWNPKTAEAEGPSRIREITIPKSSLTPPGSTKTRVGHAQRFSIMRRSNSHASLECPGEVALIAKARCKSNGYDRKLRRRQLVTRIFNPQLPNVVSYRASI